MREIKFRAWNGRVKQMAQYVTAIQMGDTQGTPSSVNVIVNGHNETWEVEHDKVELLQYTGLEDIYLEDIYESDILRVTDEDGESYVATVKWFGDEYYPAFDLKGVPATRFYDANALSTIFNSGFETCEVIGNIHENTELLGDEK